MISSRERIGQMIMIGLRSEEVTQEEASLLKDHPFGGFILFSHNLKEPKQILSLCHSLWERVGKTPPFIAIDQEGGRVHRLPKPFTHFPRAALLGRTGDSDLAFEVGLATARELSAVGINVNFAPVLDVNSNPDNPIIGDRSLSAEPGEVIKLGWSIIQGLRNGGIIPCGKHFPGHGDTAEDSHLELPTVKKDLAALKAVELPPFAHVCRHQVESLMTCHVLYPSLDPDYPATLSRRITHDLLRKELGYEGVVFGDDLEMKAISENYGLEEAVALCVGAGVDILMFSHRTDGAIRAFEFLWQQVERDRQMKARVEESYQRIKRLKDRYLDSLEGVTEEEIENFIGSSHHRKLVREIHGSL